jgi:hypothetical protein
MISTPHVADRRDEEPITITISGDSGIGKSTVWPALASVVIAGDREEIMEATYCRNTASDFWDGYNNTKHKVLLHDDFGQFREEGDLGELIACGTINEFLPQMASVDSAAIGVKGTIFKSPLIVLLSNVVDFRPTTLFSAQAIKRRLGFHIKMIKKDPKAPMAPDFSHAKFSIYEIDGKEVPVNEYKYYTLKEIQREFFFYIRQKKEKKEKVDAKLDNLLFDPNDSFFEFDADDRTLYNNLQQATRSYAQEPPIIQQKDSKLTPPQKDSKPTSSQKKRDIDLDSLKKDFFDQHESKNFGDKKLNKQTAKSQAEVGMEFPSYTTAFEALSMAFTGLATSTCMGTLYSHVAQTTIDIFNGDASCGSTIAYFFGFISTAIGSYLLIKNLYSTAQSGETNTLAGKAPLIVSQSAEEEIVYNLVKKNLVKLRYTDTAVYHNNALFIHGNILLTNEHFFYPHSQSTTKYISPGTVIEIFDPLLPKKLYTQFHFDPTKITRIVSANDKDLVLYELPITVPARPSLIRHFSSGGENILKKEALFLQLTYPSVDIILHHTHVTDDHLTTEYNISPNGHTIVTRQHDTFSYNYRSSKGDCGSPIIVKDSDCWRIVGLHAAGQSILDGQAYAIMITKKQILATIEAIEEKSGKIIQRASDFPYETVYPVTAIAENGTITPA